MPKIIGMIAGLGLLLSVLGAADKNLNIPVALQNGLNGYLMIQGSDVGSTPRNETGSGVNVWVNNRFVIQLDQALADGRDVADFQITSSSGKPLAINGVSLVVFVPAAEIDGIWTPSGLISDNRLISAEPGKEFITYSESNYGIPYLGAATSTGLNVLAAGLLRQDLSVQLRAAPSQNGLYEFQIKASVPPNRISMDYQFFISNDSTRNWFNVAERYADWVDAGIHYSQFPISKRAYSPMYDSWYWSRDQVDENLYIETARSASDAGFGTFLADSGWDTATGEYNKWLSGSTGDYTPSPQQFQNLPETFDTLRTSFNLQIRLWLQPFAVGRNSVRYPKTRDLHISIPQSLAGAAITPTELPNGPKTLEDVNLCPQMNATHQYLRDLFAEMASTYHPEGYWLDFIDGIPPLCVATHKHDFGTFGEGFTAAMGAIRETILNNDPNPVVELRAQYANLNNKSFANVWQPFDSPNDFDRMRLDALRLRPFSKGVVIGGDELYWPETADEATVARFVMTDVMTGVPSIGVNLGNSRPSSVQIVKNWMDFYNRYQKDLMTGRFRPLGSFRYPDHMIESDKRIFVYLRSQDFVTFAGSSRKQIFLMNASDIPRVRSLVSVPNTILYSMQAYNRYLQPQGAATVFGSDGRGILTINAVVQRGGMLVLTPIV